MCDDEIDHELVSRKYKIKDKIHKYFKKNKILDLLEYKFTTDLDELDSLKYQANALKDILKYLKILQNEACNKCRCKILQKIKAITPQKRKPIRRKVVGGRNIKEVLKKSISPKKLKMNINECIDDISSIAKNDDKSCSFCSISNKHLLSNTKSKKTNKIIGKTNFYKSNKCRTAVYNSKNKEKETKNISSEDEYENTLAIKNKKGNEKLKYKNSEDKIYYLYLNNKLDLDYHVTGSYIPRFPNENEIKELDNLRGIEFNNEEKDQINNDDILNGSSLPKFEEKNINLVENLSKNNDKIEINNDENNKQKEIKINNINEKIDVINNNIEHKEEIYGNEIKNTDDRNEYEKINEIKKHEDSNNNEIIGDNELLNNQIQNNILIKNDNEKQKNDDEKTKKHIEENNTHVKNITEEINEVDNCATNKELLNEENNVSKEKNVNKLNEENNEDVNKNELNKGVNDSGIEQKETGLLKPNYTFKNTVYNKKESGNNSKYFNKENTKDQKSPNNNKEEICNIEEVNKKNKINNVNNQNSVNNQDNIDDKMIDYSNNTKNENKNENQSNEIDRKITNQEIIQDHKVKNNESLDDNNYNKNTVNNMNLKLSSHFMKLSNDNEKNDEKHDETIKNNKINLENYNNNLQNITNNKDEDFIPGEIYMDDNNEEPNNENMNMQKIKEKNLSKKNLKLNNNNENQKIEENNGSSDLSQNLKLKNKNKITNKKNEDNVDNLPENNNQDNKQNNPKEIINDCKNNLNDANIDNNDNNKNLLKSNTKKNELENKLITKKQKQIDNYRKALILSLNSGFFKPRNIYNLFTFSPYIYNNINISIMLKKTITTLEQENKKLTDFISKHVSIYIFKK